MVGVAKKDSNYEKEISSIIEKNQLIENIRFPGICTDMPAAYKISDIVVSPADKPEGFGRVIAESLIMKKIILAYNYGGSQEHLEGLNSMVDCFSLDLFRIPFISMYIKIE